MDAGNTRREVRSIVFVLASAESAFEGATELDGVVNRVRLVAVGDNLHVLRVASRIVNDEVRVRELRFVESLSLHKTSIGFDFENAVTAVHAAAHDPVNLHVGLAIGACAKHDAASRIRILGEVVEILFCFVDVIHSFLLVGFRSYKCKNRKKNYSHSASILSRCLFNDFAKFLAKRSAFSISLFR